MESIALTAVKREVKGKTVSKLRNKGKIPAVMYGHNLKSTDLEVDAREFTKVFKQAGESTLVNLNVEGKSLPVLIQDVQNHYLQGQPIHIDFYAVNMDEKLKATIPFRFVGESMAVKAMAGILVKNLSEVEVECLPGDLPHDIEVNISTLNTFDDAVHVRELKVSDKVKILANPDEVVVNVTPPRSEEELKSLGEAPVAEDVTKVEGVVKPEPAAEAPAEAEPKAKE
jgi:large subunit ribosomal protein L25